ncbi:MAG: crossover junction endodeoxyribonuclease RuvC [Christensenellales bacterium]
MVILGIDPGYAIAGYGIIEKNGGKVSMLGYGAIRTGKETSIAQRLKQLGEGIDTLIAQYSPDAIAVEELFFHTNQKTAIMVAQARGVILYKACQSKAILYEYTPLQIKQALTGYGRADKAQIQQMVKVLLGLSAIPKPDDAADALAVALTHSQTDRLSSLYKV